LQKAPAALIRAVPGRAGMPFYNANNNTSFLPICKRGDILKSRHEIIKRTPVVTRRFTKFTPSGGERHSSMDCKLCLEIM
jgi:hypothetical protein